MYLIVPTKYTTLNDFRFKLFMRTLRTALNHIYIRKFIVVDSSEKEVSDFIKNIKDERVVMITQKDKNQKKGGSIREGIQYVIDNFGEDTLICFQEPEKDNMIYHYENIIRKNKDRGTYVCNPRRMSIAWESYPKEQYFSENFMNMYFKKMTGLDIDWSFGPVMLTGNVAKYWLEEDGKLWDAQIVPIYKAYLDNVNVIEEYVCFKYPEEQKELEEDNMEYIKKRKYQMDYMVEKMSNKIENKQ